MLGFTKGYGADGSCHLRDRIHHGCFSELPRFGGFGADGQCLYVDHGISQSATQMNDEQWVSRPFRQN
jgi:hypothetical protein